MRFINIIMITFISLTFYGCAQYRLHKGGYAEQVDQKKEKKTVWGSKKYETDLGLLISSKVNSSLSRRNFGMVDFIFENKSDKWIRITNVSLNFGNKKINDNVRFVHGLQSKVYFDAVNEEIEERRRIKAQNDAAWASAAAGMAAASATASRNYNSPQANYNQGLLTGMLTSISISQFQKLDTKSKDKKTFPERHLLNPDFLIPPGVYTKKWILLNTTNHKEIGRLKYIYLTYKTNDGVKEKVKVRLYLSNTQWMRDASGIPQYDPEHKYWKEKIAQNQKN